MEKLSPNRAQLFCAINIQFLICQQQIFRRATVLQLEKNIILTSIYLLDSILLQTLFK